MNDQRSTNSQQRSTNVQQRSTNVQQNLTKIRVPCLACNKTFSSKSSLSHHKKRCKGNDCQLLKDIFN